MRAEMTPARNRTATGPMVWPWLSLIPFAGVCAPIYAGARTRRVLWVALGLLWAAAVVAGFVHDSITRAGGATSDDFAGFLFILGWVGGVATSFTIRPAYQRQMDSAFDHAAQAARERLADRHRAEQMARRHPELAAEMGIGRPDLSTAAAGGVVDVNNAGVTALLGLPGVDGDLVTRIVEARQRVNGFSSLEDMGALLDLDGDLVEKLRDRTVFLPRLG